MPANGTNGQGVGMTDEEIWQIITYIRSQEVKAPANPPGNAAHGKEFSTATPTARLPHGEGKGGRFGPELTAVGGSRTRDAIIDSVRNPSRRLAWGLTEATKDFPQEYESVTVVTADGKKIKGVTLERRQLQRADHGPERADPSAGERQSALVSEEPGIDDAGIQRRHSQRQGPGGYRGLPDQRGGEMTGQDSRIEVDESGFSRGRAALQHRIDRSTELAFRPLFCFVPYVLISLPRRFAHAQVTFDRLLNSAKEPQNWMTYSGDYSGKRFSALDQINVANVHTLVAKWVYQTGSHRQTRDYAAGGRRHSLRHRAGQPRLRARCAHWPAHLDVPAPGCRPISGRAAAR